MNLLEPYNFIFELPLYTKIKIDKANRDDFLALMNTGLSIEGYNPVLKQETTYRISRNPSSSIANQFIMKPAYYTGKNLELEIRCARNDFSIVVFSRLILAKYNENDSANNEYVLMKIGQFPSVADLHISKIRQYDKILSNDKLKEITKAVGLAANGVGIGSFVYLRRVFEDLIEEAHSLALLEPNWDENSYSKSRMDEKIDLLKHHLPLFLVENRVLYSILSKGIHELDENECLEHFEAIKVGIELILDEKVEEYNKKKKLEEAKKRIQTISQQIAKTK